MTELTEGGELSYSSGSKSYPTPESFPPPSAFTTTRSVSLAVGEAATSLTLQDNVRSPLEEEGRRLLTKFNAWLVSMSLYHYLAFCPLLIRYKKHSLSCPG